MHVNWHCLKDRPMITPAIESWLHGYIQEYCAKVKGTHFKGVGGTGTHIHLAFQMEPFVMPSDFIGKVKGASSHDANKEFGVGTLEWQRGYGIVSFAKRHLPGILQYVARQKEHHENGTSRDTLEWSGDKPEEG